MIFIIIIVFDFKIDNNTFPIQLDKDINSMNGPIQISLLISALFAAILGFNKNLDSKKYFKTIKKGVFSSIKSSYQAMIILLIIGALTSTWIISGIVPAMIYYGIEIINPHYFHFF